MHDHLINDMILRLNNFSSYVTNHPCPIATSYNLDLDINTFSYMVFICDINIYHIIINAL